MQSTVKTFNARAHRQPMPITARLLDTQSELGELAKEYLAATNYGTQDFVASESFQIEFGDVLYCLFSLANELNLDAAKCLDLALQKYQARLNQKQSMGSK